MLGVCMALCLAVLSSAFADEMEEGVIPSSPEASAPASKEPQPVSDVNLPNMISSSKSAQASPASIQQKIFLQELAGRASQLRSDLAQVSSQIERDRRMEEYKAETAKRIKEFLASEKTTS